LALRLLTGFPHTDADLTINKSHSVTQIASFRVNKWAPA
jgi:hypothetical protein